MRILKFEGATMRDAIAKVKAELGDQAVIVQTRQVRRGLLGNAYEISAAIEDDSDKVVHEPAFTAAAPPLPTPKAPPERSVEIDQMRSEMRSLRALVRAADNSRGNAELRSEVAELKKLVEKLATPASHKTSQPISKQALSLGALAAVKREPRLVAASTGNIVLLVGPTGAGKTTTIAKLAARAALIDNKRVRLVTLDNYRVGGVDQIRTFAELIGVPLAVAGSAHELVQILAEDNGSYDLTLIDTAGKSPRDTSSIVELAAALPDLPAVEVHVVVPASTAAEHIDALVARFRPLSPSRLLFTKLDEVDHLGELQAAPTRCGLPITWVTTGQQVPEDIEEPNVQRLVDLAANGLSITRAA